MWTSCTLAAFIIVFVPLHVLSSTDFVRQNFNEKTYGNDDAGNNFEEELEMYNNYEPSNYNEYYEPEAEVSLDDDNTESDEDNLVARALESIGGGHLGRRSMEGGGIGGGHLSLGRRTLESIGGGHLGKRTLESIGGGHLGKRTMSGVVIPPIGGGHLGRRTLESIGGGHLGKRTMSGVVIPPIGGGNLGRRTLESIGGGHLGKRTMAGGGIGGGNLGRRSFETIGGGHLGKRTMAGGGIGGGNLGRRSFETIGGGHLGKRTMAGGGIGGGNLGRSIETIGGGHLGKRTMAGGGIGGGNLGRRSIESIGGGHLGRSIESIGGGHLVSKCRTSEECKKLNRLTRSGEMFDSLSAGGTFGVSKRLGRVRVSNRDDVYAKRRGGLDSLVAGGMFGKAAKRSDYIPLENEEMLNAFERNIRYLNTMDLGSSFGKATKRFSLDSLGNGAFGVEKRMNDESREQELKAFQLNLGNKNSNKDRFNTYRNSGNYFSIVPSYNQPKYDDETQ